MSVPEVLPGRESAPRRRTPADLRAFARAWGLLLAADLGLRLLSFPRVDRWLAPILAGAPEEASEERVVGRLVWATEAAARHHLYPMRCLPKALCLRRLLGRHGIHAELRIGVSTRDGALAAHAWVERRGVPIGETRDVEDRFPPLRSA
jgi:hypothetical protein